jgi:hypothetical protein
MFAIFDLGRYTITVQSLRALAGAGARAVMINCYAPDVTSNPTVSPSGCTCTATSTSSWCLSISAQQAAAPFLFFGGLTPTITVTAGTNSLTISASQSGFAMLMPIWGSSLPAPNASTSIPF